MGSEISRREKYRLTKNIEEGLLKIGLKKSQIEKTKNEWHKRNILDIAKPIIRDVLNILTKKENSIKVEVSFISKPETEKDIDRKKEFKKELYILESNIDEILYLSLQKNLSEIESFFQYSQKRKFIIKK